MTMTISGDGTISGLVAGGLPNATVQAADLAANAVDAQALSLLNASGSAPVYACRAWVNFNGTGTVAIRGSGNVSSITDNGTGDYTVNFTTAMPDANYVVTGSTVGGLQSVGGLFSAVVGNVASGTDVPLSTGSFRFNMRNFGGTYSDTTVVAISVFR